MVRSVRAVLAATLFGSASGSVYPTTTTTTVYVAPTTTTLYVAPTTTTLYVAPTTTTLYVAPTTTTTLYVPPTTTTLYVAPTTTTLYVPPTTTTVYVAPTTTVYGATTTTTVYYPVTTTTVYGFDCGVVACPADNPVQKGSNIKCPGALETCTVGLCCEQYATCDTFTCDLSTGFSPKDASASVMCKGGLALDIKDCDQTTCCEALILCDTFDDKCKGLKTKKGTKAETKVGVQCSASGCDIDTCCQLEATTEDTCFPGEAEVSIQDGSGVRLDAVDAGMTVLGEDGMEAILGMLHLHAETAATVAHATAVSV